MRFDCLSNQGFGHFGPRADEPRAHLHQGRLDAGLQFIDDVCKIEAAGAEDLDVLQADRITELGLQALADLRGGGAPLHSLAAGGIGQAKDMNRDGTAGHAQQPPPAAGPQPELGDRPRPAGVSTFRLVKTCKDPRAAAGWARDAEPTRLPGHRSPDLQRGPAIVAFVFVGQRMITADRFPWVSAPLWLPPVHLAR